METPILKIKVINTLDNILFCCYIIQVVASKGLQSTPCLKGDYYEQELFNNPDLNKALTQLDLILFLKICPHVENAGRQLAYPHNIRKDGNLPIETPPQV